MIACALPFADVNSPSRFVEGAMLRSRKHFIGRGTKLFLQFSIAHWLLWTAALQFICHLNKVATIKSFKFE